MKYSIVAKKKSKKIIKEMIDKVDIETFKSVVKCYVGKGYMEKIPDSVFEKYLNSWADAKYEFYVMFGNRFSLSKEVSIEINPNEVIQAITALKNQFVIYAPILNLFSTEDIINNICPKNEQLEEYCSEYYKVGMKISKFLSKYFQDVKFDIEFSKVLQNKLIKGEIAVSINPIDYLTCSINQNRWGSCYAPNNSYCTAPFAVMIDDVTLIACNRSNKLYDYEVSGSKFSYLSNRSRAFVLFNKDTCQFTVTRAQGSASNDVRNQWEGNICDCVTKYLDIKEKYTSGDRTCYEDKNSLHHIDDDVDYGKYYITGSETQDSIEIGADNLFDLITGNKFRSTNASSSMIDRG